MRKENKMLNMNFDYYIPDRGDLEGIIRLSNNIKTGKEMIRSKYPNINIEIRLKGSESYDVYYYTVIKGEKEEYLRNALSDFFKTCGTPGYVYGNCNYLVNEILQQYGKRAKGGFLSRLLFKSEVTENKEE